FDILGSVASVDFLEAAFVLQQLTDRHLFAPALARGQMARMCGQNGASRENFLSRSSHSLRRATAVTVLETLATPIGFSTVHLTFESWGCHGARAQPSAPSATTLP